MLRGNDRRRPILHTHATELSKFLFGAAVEAAGRVRHRVVGQQRLSCHPNFGVRLSPLLLTRAVLSQPPLRQDRFEARKCRRLAPGKARRSVLRKCYQQLACGRMQTVAGNWRAIGCHNAQRPNGLLLNFGPQLGVKVTVL